MAGVGHGEHPSVICSFLCRAFSHLTQLVRLLRGSADGRHAQLQRSRQAMSLAAIRWRAAPSKQRIRSTWVRRCRSCCTSGTRARRCAPAPARGECRAKPLRLCARPSRLDGRSLAGPGRRPVQIPTSQHSQTPRVESDRRPRSPAARLSGRPRAVCPRLPTGSRARLVALGVLNSLGLLRDGREHVV